MFTRSADCDNTVSSSSYRDSIHTLRAISRESVHQAGLPGSDISMAGSLIRRKTSKDVLKSWIHTLSLKKKDSKRKGKKENRAAEAAASSRSISPSSTLTTSSEEWLPTFAPPPNTCHKRAASHSAPQQPLSSSPATISSPIEFSTCPLSAVSAAFDVDSYYTAFTHAARGQAPFAVYRH
ncbi:hypothetical protein FRC02_002882 [Tulasnella sp. 418]|nr:hypothetical protein FRC02_002882 [Tulasnella sp. 418]